jgi:formate dehydrogenase subunit gamma
MSRRAMLPGASARRIGAVIVATALCLSLGAMAQSSGQSAAPAAPPITAAPSAPPVAPAISSTAAASARAAPSSSAEARTPAAGSPAAPGWNSPPAWGAASERPQYASVPGVDTNRLIQGAGREWRALRNGPVTQYGGWLLAIVLAAIALFYLVRGKIRLHGQPTGRMIERFNGIERASHWTMAISFVALAATGVVILWGKYLILPLLGYGGFSWLTIVAKNLHNFVGPLFIFSLVVSFLIFVKDNLIRAIDVKWLVRLGGLLGREEIPSGRFNGGEKAWFWGGMVLLGSIVSVTGLILDFPNWNQGRELMQQANVIHAIAAILFIAGSFAHIYMGTLGMEGAYRAMRDGQVDEAWAREHHALWYDEVKHGRRPVNVADARAQPGTAD